MFTVTWDIKRTHRVAMAGRGGIAQGAHIPAYRGVGRGFGIDVVGGADQARFSITAGGALSFFSGPNFEAFA